MDRVRGKIRLRGDFKGRRDAAIQFWFHFCDDGTYFYTVEQKGIWRLAHRGRFRISGSWISGDDARTVRLEPYVIDIDPGPHAYGELEERGLPSNHPEDYRLVVYQYDNKINSKLKFRVYSFSIPDPRGIFSVSWDLEPTNESEIDHDLR